MIERKFEPNHTLHAIGLLVGQVQCEEYLPRLRDAFDRTCDAIINSAKKHNKVVDTSCSWAMKITREDAQRDVSHSLANKIMADGTLRPILLEHDRNPATITNNQGHVIKFDCSADFVLLTGIKQDIQAGLLVLEDF